MARRGPTFEVDRTATALVGYLGYRGALDALADRSGRVVRDVPHRTTFENSVGGRRIFRKVRTRRAADAVAEWRALHELGALGIRVPAPLFLARDGDRSVIGMGAVPGGPLAELLAADPGARDVQRAVLERVAAVVRRLHVAGLVHRDLYWSHWFAERAEATADEPFLIDVERVFRPRWRRRRWRVKDLAGLVASWPRADAAPSLGLRFLRVYFGGVLPPDWKRWARSVLRKSARIRQHVPRWGSPPPWA